MSHCFLRLLTLAKTKNPQRHENSHRLSEWSDYHGNVDGTWVAVGGRHSGGGTKPQSWRGTVGGEGVPEVRSCDLCPTLKPLPITLL